MTKAIVSGTIFAEDPIFSPHGYARKVFGAQASTMMKTVKDRKMEFVFPPVEVIGQDVDATLVENIIEKMPEADYLGNIRFSVTYTEEA